MGLSFCKEGDKKEEEDFSPFSAQDKDSKVSLEDFDLLKVNHSSPISLISQF